MMFGGFGGLAIHFVWKKNDGGFVEPCNQIPRKSSESLPSGNPHFHVFLMMHSGMVEQPMPPNLDSLALKMTTSVGPFACSYFFC